MSRAGIRAAGYRSPAYAAALAGWGRPLAFGATGGHLLCRAIPGSDRHDLAGPYPLFCCTDWQALAAAVADLPAGPVSLTLVTDPFCPLSEAALAAIFPLCRPLHAHHLIPLEAPPAPSRHHRRALRQPCPARIEAGPAGPGLLEPWLGLYAGLAARRGITDLRRFDRESFRRQLAVPGLEAVTAWEGETLLGADLYYLDGGVVRAHLSAYAERGYALAVSYPMMAAAIGHFRGRADWIDLGGAPTGAGDGLSAFKRGWGGTLRQSRLCGRILDPAAYADLAARTPDGPPWFPVYRRGEFG